MLARPIVIGAMLALACGTFAIRLAGPLLHARVSFPPRARQLLESAANVLLTALVATTALTEGHGFAGYARPRPAWWWPVCSPGARRRCR